MWQTTACQVGWLAVFEDPAEPDGYFTEAVACWVSTDEGDADLDGPIVRPICALGGDVCDATLAGNYLGVVSPGSDLKKFMEAVREARRDIETTVS